MPLSISKDSTLYKLSTLGVPKEHHPETLCGVLLNLGNSFLVGLSILVTPFAWIAIFGLFRTLFGWIDFNETQKIGIQIFASGIMPTLVFFGALIVVYGGARFFFPKETEEKESNALALLFLAPLAIGFFSSIATLIYVVLLCIGGLIVGGLKETFQAVEGQFALPYDGASLLAGVGCVVAIGLAAFLFSQVCKSVEVEAGNA